MISKNNGSALITALFIVALAVTLATSMAVKLQSTIQFDHRFLKDQQLYYTAQGATFWAKGIIINAVAKDGTASDSLPLSFGNKLPNGSIISASLTDEQSKFNINSLLNPAYVPIFARLVNIAIPVVPLPEATQFATAIMKQLAHKSWPNQSFPNYFISPSQLLSLPGITPEIFKQIQPYLTALPEVTPININTADGKLLQSLSTTFNQSSAQKIVIDRQKNHQFASVADMISRENVTDTNFPTSLVTTTSSYFALTTNVSEANSNFIVIDILHRIITSDKQVLVYLLKEKVR